MPVYLNELQAGCDRTLIGFPHLLVCLGVVLQTKAWLYGFHFDALADTPASAALFAAFITNRGGDAANGMRLYGCGNWRSRYEGGGRQAWKTEMQTIANALGYHGKVSGFNTAIIDPQAGTYVEYIPEYQQERCRIYYKRNEKMDFTSNLGRGLLPRSMTAFRPGLTNRAIVPNTGNTTYTSGAGIQETTSNKGQLHELNYFLRLVSFDV
jgi:hypothetical protein